MKSFKQFMVDVKEAHSYGGYKADPATSDKHKTTPQQKKKTTSNATSTEQTT
jgi:hypothetical protein